MHTVNGEDGRDHKLFNHERALGVGFLMCFFMIDVTFLRSCRCDGKPCMNHKRNFDSYEEGRERRKTSCHHSSFARKTTTSGQSRAQILLPFDVMFCINKSEAISGDESVIRIIN